MRKAIIIILCSLVVHTTTAQTKAYISRSTKEFMLTANIRQDHKFFGYDSVSAKAKKLILFSVFTSDVKDNPNHCPLGAYYQTSDLKEGDKIVFVSLQSSFVKLNYIAADKKITTFYVLKKFVVFTK